MTKGPLPIRRTMLGPNGEVVQETQTFAPGTIRPYVAENLTFHRDPTFHGKGATWRMTEECNERAPVLGRIYIPKWLRKWMGRDAIPYKVTITVKVEYVQADPASFEDQKEP